MVQVASLRAMTDTQGATSSKGVRERGPWGHAFNLTLNIIDLQIKSKKKICGVFYGSLETYTRYSWVADEEQKKKGLRCILW